MLVIGLMQAGGTKRLVLAMMQFSGQDEKCSLEATMATSQTGTVWLDKIKYSQKTDVQTEITERTALRLAVTMIDQH